MCYICKARGTVGAQYAATQKVINAGIAAWRKSCGAPPNKLAPDMAKLPAKKLWAVSQLSVFIVAEEVRRHA